MASNHTETTKPNNMIANQPSILLSAKQIGKLHAITGTEATQTITSKEIMKLAGECIRLRKYKEKMDALKQKAEMRLKQKEVPEMKERYQDQGMQQNIADFEKIVRASIDVYAAFPFSGKEHHYQAALEEELRELGESVYQEMAVMMNYRKRNGETMQLPHDIRGREDLLLPKKHMILELKQTGKLTDKEFNQICRYMEERRQNYTWGNKTTGMLINFGDNELECWALYYAIPEGSIRNPSHLQTPRLTRVLLYKEERPPISTFVDSFVHLINKS